MRATEASSQERLLNLWDRYVTAGRKAGVFRLRIDDYDLDAAYLTIHGQKLANFGSCAYLGLNTDPRLKDAAKSAIDRYGPVYSSSAVYTSVGLYTELEQKLRTIVGAPVIVASTTTLAHLATIPTLVGENDAVLIDTQAHASVQLASRIVSSAGIPVIPVPHNNMLALEKVLHDEASKYRHVWFLADGVYSMFGDAAPVAEFERLLNRVPNLYLYVDDAHGFGWMGRNGAGWILGHMKWHPRLILAFSLAKSWGSGGAALAFPDETMASRVLTVGSTLTFSGPLHPAELGASVAAADIHLSAEHHERQQALFRQIDLIKALLEDAELPVMPTAATPLWFIKVGSFSRAAEVGKRMMARGFYVNVSTFPAVPMRMSGIRFTNTLFHSDEQIMAMISALSDEIAYVREQSEILIDLT